MERTDVFYTEYNTFNRTCDCQVTRETSINVMFCCCDLEYAVSFAERGKTSLPKEMSWV